MASKSFSLLSFVLTLSFCLLRTSLACGNDPGQDLISKTFSQYCYNSHGKLFAIGKFQRHSG